MKPVVGIDNTWHTEHDGDSYFVALLTARSWRVTRQVDCSSVYRSHLVTLRRNNTYLCDCDGFRRGGKCRHVQMVGQL